MVVRSMESGLGSEVANVSVLNASDMAENMPNTRSFVRPPHVVTVSVFPKALVTTPEGIFGEHLEDSAAIKTTQTGLREQSNVAATLLKSSQSSLTISPNVLTKTTERKYKYSWDPSVFDPVLPVRCRNLKGELHKNRFGSGGRGRCIHVGENNWYTPSEFEELCGRGSSKDWKRSIRYAGRTLQCLIEENILQPHATACTCSACCDNAMVVSGGITVSNATSGPVRLFTPYKRRKRLEKRQHSEKVTTSNENSVSDSLVVSLASSDVSPSGAIQVVAASANLVDTSSVPYLVRDVTNLESVIVTPVTTPQTPRSAPTALDFNEQRQWWQLEEMAKNLFRQTQELQKQVETAKAQAALAKDAALQQLKIQMENEKKEALNTSRIEAQMNLSRAILEAKAEKDLAIQQARLEMQEKLETMVTTKGDPSKMCRQKYLPLLVLKFLSLTKIPWRCANCDRDALSECTGCHRVSYCGTFCQRKDWQTHRHNCGESALGATEECVEEPAEEPVEECDSVK